LRAFLESEVMRVIERSAAGRADPLGLLVVAVILALTVTIGIQAQTLRGEGTTSSSYRCDTPCMNIDIRR
jgi:hypothetical protein